MKINCGLDDLTVSESATFYGLFCHGWRHASKYHNQTNQAIINEIKAQGVEEAIKKADSETYIGIVGEKFPPQSQYKAELLAYADKLRSSKDE